MAEEHQQNNEQKVMIISDKLYESVEFSNPISPN